MKAPIIAFGTVIVRERDGLYCLNDMHRASGNLPKHQPAFFLRNDQTKALIEEVQSENSQSAVRVVNGGPMRGTYACRELVIAYAAWISPSFHLKVIRVFLNAAHPAATGTPPAAPYWALAVVECLEPPDDAEFTPPPALH